MREVDEFKDAIDHRISQSDRGIDEADSQPIDQHLRKIRKGVGEK
jgi:hypothetical protein